MRSRDWTIVGLHPGKTGGTTLHAHIKERLDPQGGYYVCGVHEDAARIMKGERLLVEYESEDLDRIAFVFGHRLRLEEALLVPEECSLLFTIARDPYERFVSMYKHYLRTRNDSGEPKSAREYLDKLPENPLATTVAASFGGLAGGVTEGHLSETFIADVLSKLDFVLSTERLDEQGEELCELIGLRGPERRSRVYPETPNLEGVTREDIYARHYIDLYISESARTSGGLKTNPFGAGRKDRKQCRREIVDSKSWDERISEAYMEAFAYMNRNEMLYALQEVIAKKSFGEVADRFEEYCQREEIELSEDKASVGEKIEVARVLIELKMFGEAAEMLRELSEIEPTSFSVHYHLARALRRIGPRRSAEAACRRAIEINGTNRHVKTLLFQITGETE